jgi:hypothetical protein
MAIATTTRAARKIADIVGVDETTVRRDAANAAPRDKNNDEIKNFNNSNAANAAPLVTATAQREIKKRKPRKPRPPIAEPEHGGRYYVKVTVPWICRLELDYRARERAERRAKKRAEQRAEQRALKEGRVS